MSAFLHRFVEHKKYIIIAIGVVFFCGFLFGFFEYYKCQQNIQDFFKSLFYLNDKKYTNDYPLYLLQNILFILICTYLSSSYLGHLGILFFVFIKGVQISFSLVFVSSIVSLQFLTILFILIEMIVEIAFVVVLSSMSIHLSIYVTLISFYIEQNLHIKSTMNYRLNYLIATLLILSFSLALRVYFIPMF